MTNFGFLFELILRNIAGIIVLFLITRIMGKKQISQLTFFDYAAGITIGSIAAAFSVDSKIGYLNGLTSLGVWGLFAIVVTYSSLKSMRFRRLVGDTPSVLIQNGKIMEQNLRKERFNINDVLEELRVKGVFNVADVEFALLETNGQVSVQLKSQKKPLTPSDINIPTKYQGLTANLIIDGEVMINNLKMVDLDEKWLIHELEERGIDSYKNVLLAALDTQGTLHIDMKNKDPEEIKVLE